MSDEIHTMEIIPNTNDDSKESLHLNPVALENETEFERTQRLKINTDEAPHSGVMSDDIAKILQEVKLPERRDFKALGDVRSFTNTPKEMQKVQEEQIEHVKDVPVSQSPHEQDIVTPLRTLKDDIQNIVRIRKISLVRASALEQDKKRPDIKKPVIPAPGVGQRTRRSFAFIFFTLLLIGVGSAALYGVNVVKQSKSAIPASPFPSIIFAEQSITLPIDNTAPGPLKSSVVTIRSQSGGALGSLTRIIPTVSSQNGNGTPQTVPAGLGQFFTALGIHPPDELVRGLGDTFFFGIHTVDKDAPVFVIPVTSYEHAFAGMLAWETSMNANLTPIFTGVPNLTTSANGLPTQRLFSDAIMLNYDIRVLKDDAGTVELYYSFPTPNILVIAESPHTFTEVLSRLQAQRKL